MGLLATIAPDCRGQGFGPPPADSPIATSAQALAAFASPAPASAEARLTDGAEPMAECEVIGRINGQVVTACEVLWQVELMLEDKKDRIPPAELPKIRRHLTRRFLMEMVDMKILYADFRRKVPEADLEAIYRSLAEQFEEKEVPRLMKRVGVEDSRDLPARLAKLGTSLREQRAEFYDTMIARSWINEQVEISREVTHDELLAYYTKKGADYDYPTQAKWEELMVRFDRYSSKAEAYRALAEIGNEAYRAAIAQPDKSKPAFVSLAKAKSHGFTASDGGQHDWTTQGSLTAERVDEALFSVAVGEMSPILESDRGFHIVRVLDRKLAGRTAFTEVQDEIRKKILKGRTDKAFAKKLDELRRTARIWTLYDGYIDPVEYAASKRPKAKRR